MFILYGQASKNYKLISLTVSDLFMYITSTSTYTDYVEVAQ